MTSRSRELISRDAPQGFKCMDTALLYHLRSIFVLCDYAETHFTAHQDSNRGILFLTVVVYDYMLTFTREVELVWMKPWSILSSLFIVSRYLGLAVVLITGLWSGLGVTAISSSVCFIVTYQLHYWAELVWSILIHIMVILCISALFSNPKKVKWTLMFLLSLVMIVEIVCEALSIGPRFGFSVSSTTLFGVNLCSQDGGRYSNLLVDSSFPVFALDILLMVMVVYRFVRHSIEMRKTLGKRKVNEYMKLLVQHNTLYFIFIVIVKTIGIAVQYAGSAPLWIVSVELLLAYTIPFVFYPRIVLNFRGHRAASGGVYAYSGSHSLPSHSRSQSQSQLQRYIPLQISRLSGSSGQTKSSGDFDESSVYAAGKETNTRS